MNKRVLVNLFAPLTSCSHRVMYGRTSETASDEATKGAVDMPIENRELAVGARLVARYKGKEHLCEVVQTDDGIAYRMGGMDYTSPSSAGRSVTGGIAVNGWRFWSLDGTLTDRKLKAVASAKKGGAKTAKAKEKKGASNSSRKPAKKAARSASKAAYGCGTCSETFDTMKAATKHALTHNGA